MSASSFTDWLIKCDRPGCGRQFWASEVADMSDMTAAGTRKELKQRGWRVNVPNPVINLHHINKRLDYCPEHAAALDS